MQPPTVAPPSTAPPPAEDRVFDSLVAERDQIRMLIQASYGIGIPGSVLYFAFGCSGKVHQPEVVKAFAGVVVVVMVTALVILYRRLRRFPAAARALLDQGHPVLGHWSVGPRQWNAFRAYASRRASQLYLRYYVLQVTVIVSVLWLLLWANQHSPGSLGLQTLTVAGFAAALLVPSWWLHRSRYRYLRLLPKDRPVPVWVTSKFLRVGDHVLFLADFVLSLSSVGLQRQQEQSFALLTLENSPPADLARRALQPRTPHWLPVPPEAYATAERIVQYLQRSLAKPEPGTTMRRRASRRPASRRRG